MMAENFPILMKERDVQIQEAQNFKKDESKEIHRKTHYN